MSLSALLIATRGIGGTAAGVAARGFVDAGAQTWDTSQGAARNLAKKLAFERTVDAEARPVAAGICTGAHGSCTAANAHIAPRRVGARTGYQVPEHESNAFVRPSGAGAIAGFVAPAAAGNAFYVAPQAGVSSGGGLRAAYGGAVAGARIARTAAGASGTVAWGVQNPGDEQIALLAVLVTKNARNRAHMHKIAV